MICATPGCVGDCMPGRDHCAACVWEIMAEKARSAPPKPRQYKTPDDDPGEEMQGGGDMRGWETPPVVRAAMREPIGPDTPLAVLEALRDDAAVRAEIFPDAELARQALELLVAQRRIPPKEAERLAAAADAKEGVVVDDRDDCLGCQ